MWNGNDDESKIIKLRLELVDVLRTLIISWGKLTEDKYIEKRKRDNDCHMLAAVSFFIFRKMLYFN